MARYQAIAATSQAIVGLLQQATADSTEFAGTQFDHYAASDLQSPMAEGVSLYLYRVTVNTARRNLAPRLGPDGRRFRPSIPLDLHYLLIAWAEDPVRQQRLLGWCVRVLEDTPILPPGLLNHFGPETDVFGPTETVDLTLEALSQQDQFDIWEGARSKQQPAATYVARMVVIDSEVALAESPDVQTRDLGYPASTFDPVAQRLVPAGEEVS